MPSPWQATVPGVRQIVTESAFQAAMGTRGSYRSTINVELLHFSPRYIASSVLTADICGLFLSHDTTDAGIRGEIKLI
jgi:hypothetical protein